MIGIGALSTRGSKDHSNNSRQLRLDDIMRTSHSIHDSSVLPILRITDALTLQTNWAVVQQQFIDVAGRIAALAAEVSDPNSARTLQDLGAALAGLDGALGSNVSLRLDPSAATAADLVEQSKHTVLERYQQLEAAIRRSLYLRVRPPDNTGQGTLITTEIRDCEVTVGIWSISVAAWPRESPVRLCTAGLRLTSR